MHRSEKTTFRVAVESAVCSSATFLGWCFFATRYNWFAVVLMLGAVLWRRTALSELQVRTEALTPRQKRILFSVYALPPALLAVAVSIIALLIGSPKLWTAAGLAWLFLAPLFVLYYYRIYNDRSKVA